MEKPALTTAPAESYRQKMTAILRRRCTAGGWRAIAGGFSLIAFIDL